MINLPDENKEPISITIPSGEGRKGRSVIVNYNDGTAEEKTYSCVLVAMADIGKDTCQVSVLGRAIECMAASTAIVVEIADLLESKPRKGFANMLKDLANIIESPGSASAEVLKQAVEQRDKGITMDLIKDLLNKFKNEHE